jgi:hypothetical protein
MAYKIKTTATNGKAPIKTTHSNRSNTSPFKRTGDYSTETGQRLSTIEADELIADEGRGAVTSTYGDAVKRAKTPEEKAAAEQRMDELSKTERGRGLIERDKQETKELEGTYDEGWSGPDTFGFPDDKSNPEQIKAWSGSYDAKGGVTPTTDAKEKKKADREAARQKEIDAINKKYSGKGD